jgi:hypothetical protein
METGHDELRPLVWMLRNIFGTKSCDTAQQRGGVAITITCFHVYSQMRLRLLLILSVKIPQTGPFVQTVT